MGLLIFDFAFGLLCFSAWTGILWLIGVPVEIAGAISGVLATLLFFVLVAAQSGWEGDDERYD